MITCFCPIPSPRDPRAVLHSQSRVWQHWFNWSSDLEEVSTKYCAALSEDVANFKRLKQAFPSRVKLVRYEDGALHPHDYTRDLYTFLHLDYTPSVRDIVTELTTPEGRLKTGKRGNQYSLHRDDPVKSMQKWRWRPTPLADYGTVSIVDKNCGHLYSLMGYRKISSLEDLKSNTSLVLQQGAGLNMF